MNTKWNHGYFCQEGYEYGYHTNNSPTRIHWACTMQGVKAPKSHFTYLDLGCGQGINLILHAAVHPESQFIGVDFMPRHIGHARGLAEYLGLSNIKFIEGDFIELAKKPPEIENVDYVVAHGISAWVSKDVRHGMWALIEKVLKPGGIVFNSYNTFPGWADAVSFQHLIMQCGFDGGGSQAIPTALKKMDLIREAKSPIFDIYPVLQKRLERVINSDLAYANQEYGNQHWEPKHVANMLDEVEQYKLDYIGTANFLQMLKSSYNPDAYSLIEAEASIKHRETIRDLLICQTFRYDLYGKGAQPLWQAEKNSTIAEQRFVTLDHSFPQDGETFSTNFASQKVCFPAHNFKQVLNTFGPEGKSVAEVQAILKELTLLEIAEVATYLCHDGMLGICSEDKNEKHIELNKKLSDLYLKGAPYTYAIHARAKESFYLDKIQALLLAFYLKGIRKDDLFKELRLHMSLNNKNFTLESREVTDEDEAKMVAQNNVSHFLSYVLPKVE